MNRFLIVLLIIIIPKYAYSIGIESKGGVSILSKHFAGYTNPNRPPYKMEYYPGSYFSNLIFFPLTHDIEFQLEYLKQNNRLKRSSPLESSVSGHVKNSAYFANILKHVSLNNSFYFYVGLGVGWGKIKMEALKVNQSLSINDHDNIFQYQLLLGFKFPLQSKLFITLNYSLLQAFSQLCLADEQGERMNPSFKTHNLSAGLKFSF